MNTLDFIASIIHSILSWPVAVVLVAFILQDSIAGVIDRLGKLSYKGMGQELSVETGQVMKHVAIDASLAGVSKDAPSDKGEPITGNVGEASIPSDKETHFALTDTSLEHSEFSDLRRLVDISPNAAVLMAWTVLEREMNRAIMRLGLDTRLGKLSGTDPRVLKEAGFIGEETWNLLMSMRTARNHIAHTADVQMWIADSLLYVNLAETLTQHMMKLNKGGVQN